MSAPPPRRNKKAVGSCLGCCVPRLNWTHYRQKMSQDTPDGSHMTRRTSRNVCKSLKVAPTPAGVPATPSKGKLSVASHISKAKSSAVGPKRSNAVSLQDPAVDSANIFDGDVESSHGEGKSAEVSLPASSSYRIPVRSRPIASIGAVKYSGMISTPINTDTASSQRTPITKPTPITRNASAARTVRFALPGFAETKSKDLGASSSKFFHGESITDCIRADVGTQYDHLQPLGTRCQLCKLDLAFTPETSGSAHAYVLPPTAVLPCGHCYHDKCLQDVFGPEEPSCISCSSC